MTLERVVFEQNDNGFMFELSFDHNYRSSGVLFRIGDDHGEVIFQLERMINQIKRIAWDER